MFANFLKFPCDFTILAHTNDVNDYKNSYNNFLKD